MNPGPIPVNEQLEQILFEFERSWFNDQTTRVEDFLPSPKASNYIEILTELARSEMELRAEEGKPFGAQDYLDRFPILARDDMAKQAVVFEEFRLRRARGEAVAAESFSRRFGINSTQWPCIVAADDSMASRRRATSTTPGSKPRKKIKFPKVGETIDGFELVGLLGEGAFGRVFLAQQGELEGRLVVLKFTSVKTDEHRLLARLQHTHIVPIHSVHRIDDLQAICMPLLGVATLSDILQHCGKKASDRVSQQSNAMVQTVNRQRELTVAETISDQENAQRFRSRQRLSAEIAGIDKTASIQDFAAKFICQMADGLGYAHQRGIVHGDLKPANLLVNDDGEAIILDFHLGSAKDDDVGQLVGGTLPYMAPEHLRAMSDRAVELRPTMDVYSAGVILYELLTGTIPFEDELNSTFSPDELAKAKNRPFVIPASQRKMIGEDLAAIVETCVDSNPDERFQNGAELAVELRRALDFQPLQTASKGSFKNRIAKWAKRNPRLSSGTTVLAACSLIIVATTIAFALVSSRLNRINAINQSQSHIKLAGSLNPSLATSLGLHDRSFFESAIVAGERLLDINSWSNKDDLYSQKYFGRLDSQHVESESLAAAELHFWLAEAHRKINPGNDGDNDLTRALEHNQIADVFWPNGLSKVSIQKQTDLIQRRLQQLPLTDARTNTDREPDNRFDRKLSTGLLERNAGARESIYRKMAVEEQDDFMNWLLLGNACAEQEKFEQAEAYYTVCLSVDPQSMLPPLYRGIARMEQGKIKLALVDLELANKRFPEDITILLNYALALGKNREHEKALEKYNQAINLGAQQTRAWYLRSRLRSALDDKAGADADYQAFMKMEPSDSKSYITRGVQKIGSKPKEAIADFLAALNYDSRSYDAYNNLAHVYAEKLEETEKAIEYMHKAIEIDPLNPKPFASRGVLYSRLGQVEPAIDDAKAALRLDRSADTQYRVAGIYAQLSKLDKQYAQNALGLLAQAAIKDPLLVIRMNADDPDLRPIQNETTYKQVFAAITSLQSGARKKQK